MVRTWDMRQKDQRILQQIGSIAEKVHRARMTTVMQQLGGIQRLMEKSKTMFQGLLEMQTLHFKAKTVFRAYQAKDDSMCTRS